MKMREVKRILRNQFCRTNRYTCPCASGLRGCGQCSQSFRSGLRVGWNTVAAIGFIESAHGAYGGGGLTPAGQASEPIVGPGLDGNGFAAIAGRDAGVLDGDARWDRAVGPMQFIPSTWELAGRNGNGDGEADPFNIDDAALSAAGYLCTLGRDLTAANGWTQAIYSYNQSDSYVDQVRRQATSYAEETGANG